MADYTTTKLKPDDHVLLDQPLLRLPLELTRKTFTTAQRYIKHDKEPVLSTLSSPNTLNGNTSQVETLDSMISRLKTLKRKLSNLHDEEMTRHAQSKARLNHLAELYTIPGLTDVKYEQWSRVRLDRLLVDYLLRMGYGESARELAKAKGIEELVDTDAFVACFKIEKSLRDGRVDEALAWCKVNTDRLKKLDSDLEYELRLQQYVELLRSGTKQKEAALHARKYLITHSDPEFVQKAAGLLAFTPDTAPEPYRSLYAAERWSHLASLFLQTHHTLFSLPSRPLLHTALSAGLSALKTPSCHSAYASTGGSSAGHMSGASVCPICSTELNELARNVPYAQHSKSHVDNDPVVLPNGRIYGRERLMRSQEKMGVQKGLIKDLLGEGLFTEADVRKVFIL